uniref:Uncharacterized protein n=1 Tax=Parascaris equorum TaxID=6256 RepID=A0A914RAA1_PAREQ
MIFDQLPLFSIEISYQIYGANSFHMINILNNFDECSGMLPGYYCNYAEALFHCGQKYFFVSFHFMALQIVLIHLEEYTRRFLQEIEKDIKGSRRRSWLWLW